MKAATPSPRGLGKRSEGDSLREIEEWSALGSRDIDGQTREVAGELLGRQ